MDPASGERRQLTVMFCDIVGWSETAERLDPEDAADVLHAYHSVCAEAVAREGGHVAQLLGDGVMVYFGYPEAHEDDPKRAVRAALAIKDAVRATPSERLRSSLGASLRVRAGIHTGLTVVGPGSGLAVGSVPNLAARLQELAGAGNVVVSDATHRLLAGRFKVAELGAHGVKGFDQAVVVYRVEAEQPQPLPQSSLARAARAQTPFVGRELELAQLAQLWSDVRSGAARRVLVTGDAGIGKSRLVRQFIEAAGAGGEPLTWLHALGSPTHQNTPFYPLLGLLAQLGEDGPEERGLLTLLAPSRVEREQLTQIDPSRLLRIIQAAREVIGRRTAIAPLVIAVEDLHWIDPSTRDVLDALHDLPRVLWLLTSRSFVEGARLNVSLELPLERLTTGQAEVIVRWLGGGNPSSSLIETVLGSTDGVPLFIEEQTKMLLETAGTEAALPIAASLQASLLARLDRLGEAKRVAQYGAVVGRSVPLFMLERGLGLSRAALEPALARLLAAGVFTTEAHPDTYTFKHALVQEAAYHSLLRSDRRRYHGVVARTMQQSAPALAEREPEVLAHHFAQAQDLHQAARYAYAAGRRSLGAAAYREGLEHFRTALSHCRGISESEQRRLLELQILSLLGICLLTTEGYGSAEAKATFERARELSRGQEVDDTFHVLRGLWGFFVVVPDFPRARALGLELSHLARQAGDRALASELGPVLGLPALFAGELAVARQHFEECLELCGEERSQPAVLFSEDPAVTALSLLGWVHWLAGDDERALESGQRGIAFAKRIGHAHSQAYAMAFTAVLLYFRRDARAALELTLELEALCTEYGFPTWLAVGQMVRGWALAVTGDPSASSPLVEQSFELWEKVGVGLNRPQRLGLRAEVRALAKDLAGAESDLHLALATSERAGDHYYDAELHRMLGDRALEREPPDPAEARARYKLAIAIATAQGARALAARASASLAELDAPHGTA